MVKLILASFVILLVVVIFVMFWAAGGLQKEGESAGEILTREEFLGRAYQPSNSKVPDSVRIMSWNIAYGHGTGSAGVEYHKITHEKLISHLNGIAEVIIRENPDILLLQEVDMGSGRSHFLDEVDYLSEKTAFPYIAKAISWRANYVPYPYFRFKDHFGKMISGGVVMSRFPVLKNQVRLLTKPKNQSFIVNLFYLFRFSQRVTIQIGEQLNDVINNHLEAFDKKNRMAQAIQLKSSIETSEPQSVLIVGGDLNTTPSYASKRSHFMDEPRDDYEGDETLAILSSMTHFYEILDQKTYLQDEKKYFTFPADLPSRRLDYLFVNKKAKMLKSKFIQVKDYSDHLPILVEIKL